MLLRCYSIVPCFSIVPLLFRIYSTQLVRCCSDVVPMSLHCCSDVVPMLFRCRCTVVFSNTIFVSSHMYPENPEGTQVTVGSMNMRYISDTARNQTHNLLFRPKREPIPLGHSDDVVPLLLRCRCTVVPMLFRCRCTVVPMLFRCRCTVVPMLLRYRCTVVTMLFRCRSVVLSPQLKSFRQDLMTSQQMLDWYYWY